MNQSPHAFIEPWTEDADENHPGIGTARHILERHSHWLQHDQSDDFQYIAASAAYVDSAGPRVEFGPWSMSESDARCLATSLIQLADVIAELNAGTLHRKD